MRGPSAIERSQKKLFLAVKKELALYERKKRRELAEYEFAFRASLPQKVRTSTRKKLLTAISGANVILVGDFHPFRQSQKGFIRLVEGSAANFSQPVIALECFQQVHQTALNEFLSGLVTSEELRDKIDFERYWPFSWENYREILILARKNHIPVIALNIHSRSKGGALRERDKAAAQRIALEIQRHRQAAVFALYGELHLGGTHLPFEIRKELGRQARTVIVHQNNVDLYWQAPLLSDGQKPEVLRLGPREFCILNSVPWVKLRSYLDWLEGSPTPEFDGDEVDVVGMVHHYARLLAEALGINVRVDDSVEILPPDRISARGLPTGFQRLAAPDRRIAQHSLAYHRTGYLPGRATLVLPTVSTNSMSEAATHLLRHSLHAPQGPRSAWTSDDWISHFMLAYLGSKILNPKRKCNEVADLKILALPVKDRLLKTRSEIAGRALSLLRPYLKGEGISQRKEQIPGLKEIEACRSAGFVLGERYFLALLMKPGLLTHLKEILHRPNSRALIKEISARIASLRVSPASKLDRF